MTKPPKARPAGPDEQRRQRLAAALRDNLRRRKTQSRARQDAETPEVDTDSGAAAENSPPAKDR